MSLITLRIIILIDGHCVPLRKVILQSTDVCHCAILGGKPLMSCSYQLTGLTVQPYSLPMLINGVYGGCRFVQFGGQWFSKLIFSCWCNHGSFRCLETPPWNLFPLRWRSPFSVPSLMQMRWKPIKNVITLPPSRQMSMFPLLQACATHMALISLQVFYKAQHN